MALTAPPAAPPRPDGRVPPRVGGARARGIPWVALGVVLVVGGALVGGLTVQEAGDRVPVVIAAHDIAPGQLMAAQDLAIVDVAVDGDAAVVPATRQHQLVGQTAATRIPKGSLLNFAQFDSGSLLGPGQEVVGALLGPGGVPVPNLRVGDHVRLVEVADGADREGDVLGLATVYLVTPGTQPGTQFVSLAVDTALVQRVGDAAATQRLRLALQPVVAHSEEGEQGAGE